MCIRDRRGIGFETVRSFLQNGAKVAMLGSRQETVDHAMALLMEEDHTYPVKGYHPDPVSYTHLLYQFDYLYHNQTYL